MNETLRHEIVQRWQTGMAVRAIARELGICAAPCGVSWPACKPSGLGQHLGKNRVHAGPASSIHSRRSSRNC